MKTLSGSNVYWWLRTPQSSSVTDFYLVDETGDWITGEAIEEDGGISPAFRLYVK